MVKVVKFGGSSLASADQFQKVCDIIRADKNRRFVVDSAPGRRFDDDEKVTDLLYRCHREAYEGEDFTETLDKIRKRFEDIVRGLNLKVPLAKEFDLIAENLKNGASEDYAASRGEYLNGMILAACLDCDFVDAAEVVRFFPDGTFDAETTNVLMSMRLENVQRAVIPGFYGLVGTRDDNADAAKDPARIKTFSRGGSDVTGSIVARAVNADVYENWTDVSGFMIADPHIIPNVKRIETITYQELRELAYMGATVRTRSSPYASRAFRSTSAIQTTRTIPVPGLWNRRPRNQNTRSPALPAKKTSVPSISKKT